MAEGFSTAAANSVLDAQVTAYPWFKLHVGAPGANGTANPGYRDDPEEPVVLCGVRSLEGVERGRRVDERGRHGGLHALVAVVRLDGRHLRRLGDDHGERGDDRRHVHDPVRKPRPDRPRRVLSTPTPSLGRR
jgi:hypothetical protein